MKPIFLSFLVILSLAIIVASPVRAQAPPKGVVYEWGSVYDSEIKTPKLVPGLTEVIAVARGDRHALALKSDGTVWAWGSNQFGQLGNGTTTNSATPVQIPDLSGIVAISSGSGSSLALKNDGTVWKWGYVYYNSNTKTHEFIMAPEKVEGLSEITAIEDGKGGIVNGDSFSVALRRDGTVWAWGVNQSGQLGNGTITQSAPTKIPSQVLGLTDVTAISAGNFCLALKKDGTVWQWGRGKSTPEKVEGLPPAQSIAGGGDHAMALSGGEVWTWGSNSTGQLGIGTGSITFSPIPLKIEQFTSVVAIAAGYAHNIAVKSDQSVWVWGDNYSGQLGIGSDSRYHENQAKSSPTLLSNGPPVYDLSANYMASMALVQPVDPSSDVTAPRVDIVPMFRKVDSGWTSEVKGSETDWFFEVYFVLSATDGFESGFHSISYTMTGAENRGPIQLKDSFVNVRNFPQGETTIQFTARDNTGNVFTSKPYTFGLDNRSAIGSIDIRPYPGVLPGQSVVITVTADEPLYQATLTIKYVNTSRIETFPLQESGPSNTYTLTYTTPSQRDLQTGYEVVFNAKDRVGYPASFRSSFFVDGKPPDTRLYLNGKESKSITTPLYNAPISLELVAYDFYKTEKTYYAFDSTGCSPASLDGCSVYTGPFTYGEEGKHILIYFSRDALGNMEDPKSYSFTVQLPLKATDQTLHFNEDTPQEITLTATSPRNAPLTFTLLKAPEHGTLSAISGNKLTFTPAPNYYGPDSFTYRANDGTLDSNTATVTLAITPVNDPPTAQDVTLNAFKNRALPVSLSATDADGDYLMYALSSPPAHGTLSGNPPHLTYTPEPGYTGPDVFTFKAGDGQAESAPATVSLDVVPPMLTLGGSDTATLPPGGILSVPVLLTDIAPLSAGVELALKVSAPEGAPALTPAYSLSAATAGWQLAGDPQNPWHVTMAGSSGVQGPETVLWLNVQSSPSIETETVYHLRVAGAFLTNERGIDTAVTDRSAPFTLVVRPETGPCEVRKKGDVTGEGSVDLADAVTVLRVSVGMMVLPNECARSAADVSCDGRVKVGDAVLLLRHLVFGEPFPACP
ncbi:MAG: tandem-95 repeat protein [Armatimonadetes bacterium]|nr:tandem-95 repeat protein [Armatimonadota bacterium]